MAGSEVEEKVLICFFFFFFFYEGRNKLVEMIW